MFAKLIFATRLLSLAVIFPFAAHGAGGSMSIMLTCEASATIAPERATEICETFRKELRLAYPDHEIVQNINSLQGAELTLRITAATKSLLSIQLDWTAPSGETAKGQI